MRLLLLSILFSLSFILASCGGGGGGSSSGSQVKVALDLDFENGRTTDDGFYVSNTKITKVSLSYSNDKGSSGSLDVTESVSSGVIELTDLVADTTYKFILVATSDENIQACTGSTSVTISPDVTNDADLTCVFIDTLAIENSVYEFATALNSSAVTAASIDSFIAQDFGLFNGQTRDAFISELIEDNGFNFSDSGITLTKVDIQLIEEEAAEAAESRAAVRSTAGSEADLLFYFSDGSILKERVWVIKEDGNWVLTGNNRNYEIEMNFAAYYTIPSGSSGVSSDVTESFYSGIETDFYDPAELIESVTLTSSILSGDYLYEKHPGCDDCDSLELVSPSQSGIPSVLSYDFINLYDSNASSSVTDNPVFNIASVNKDDTEDSETYTITGSSVALADLTEGHFISVPDSTSKDIAGYINSSHEFTFQKPTAYDPVMIEFSMDLNDNSGGHDYIEANIPLTSTSITVDFTEFTEFVPVNGTLELTAVDSEGRLFTTVIELFNSASGLSALSSGSITTLLSAHETMSTPEFAGMVTVMASANFPQVQALLTAIADGADNGMPQTVISDAFDNASNPYNVNAPNYPRYQSIVDTFAALQSVDSAGASGIDTFVSTISSGAFSSFVAVVNAAESDGFNTFSNFFSQDVSDIITTLDSALTAFMKSIDVDYSDYYGASARIYSEDNYVICNSVDLAGSTNASLYTREDSDEFLVEFDHSTPGYAPKICNNLLAITDTSSSFNEHFYVVGFDGNKVPIISFFDNVGFLSWSKRYTSSDVTLELIDSAMVGENVLVLFSDDSNIYLVEVDTTGAVVNNKKIAITDNSTGTYDANLRRLKVFPDANIIALVGSFIESSGPTNDEPFIIYGSYTQGASKITFGPLAGQYVEFEEAGNTNRIDAVFDDVELIAADKFALVGSSYTIDGGDLLVSLLNLTTGSFYHNIYDNKSTYSDPSSNSRIVHNPANGYLYLSAFHSVTGYTELMSFNFDSSNNYLVSNQASLYDASNDVYFNNMYPDPTTGRISFVGDYGANTAATMLLGAFDGGDLYFDSTYFSPHQFTGSSSPKSQVSSAMLKDETDNAITINVVASGVSITEKTFSVNFTETDLTP